MQYNHHRQRGGQHRASITTANLIPRKLKENKPGDKGRGDFEVDCAASDNCSVTASGLMQIPAGFDAQGIEVQFNFEPGIQSEINFRKDKDGVLSIELQGADEAALRAQLADILAAAGVAVADGQLLDLRFEVEDDEEDFDFQFENGVLVKEVVERANPLITMLCTATDGSGSTGTSAPVVADFSQPVMPTVAVQPGGVETLASENFRSAGLPEGFSLAQNHPNLFNPTTTITFAVPEAGEVTLSIYNMRGQLIQTLHSGFVAAGQHSKVWNGTDFRGAKVASGVNVYQLKAKGFVATRKLTLTK